VVSGESGRPKYFESKKWPEQGTVRKIITKLTIVPSVGLEDKILQNPGRRVKLSKHFAVSSSWLTILRNCWVKNYYDYSSRRDCILYSGSLTCSLFLRKMKSNVRQRFVKQEPSSSFASNHHFCVTWTLLSLAIMASFTVIVIHAWRQEAGKASSLQIQRWLSCVNPFLYLSVNLFAFLSDQWILVSWFLRKIR
jgi:hypothetical protein